MTPNCTPSSYATRASSTDCTECTWLVTKTCPTFFRHPTFWEGGTSLSSFVVITSDHPGLEGVPEISLQVKPEGGKVNHNQLELLETANTSSSLLTLYLL